MVFFWLKFILDSYVNELDETIFLSKQCLTQYIYLPSNRKQLLSSSFKKSTRESSLTSPSQSQSLIEHLTVIRRFRSNIGSHSYTFFICPIFISTALTSLPIWSNRDWTKGITIGDILHHHHLCECLRGIILKPMLYRVSQLNTVHLPAHKSTRRIKPKMKIATLFFQILPLFEEDRIPSRKDILLFLLPFF